MIRRVASLAQLSLRAALRSRFVVAVLSLLTIVALVLPRTIRGDGTPASDIRMLLTWTLGTSFALLAVATLGAGCSALAGEIEEGVFPGIAITPVHAFELWLGKWLGLVTLNALLLLALFVVVAAQTPLRGVPLSHLRPSRLVLTTEESLQEQAALILHRARLDNVLPPEDSDEAWLATILADLRDEYLSVNPGDSHAWRFVIPNRGWRSEEDLLVRLAYSSPMGSAGGVSGHCRLLNAAGEEIATAEITPDDRQQIAFALPAAKLGNSPTLALQFTNTSDEDGSAVLINAASSASLLVPQGSIVGNMLRAGLVLWAVLAAIAGIAISAGAMFSSPVAIFVASTITLIALLSHARTDIEPEGCGHAHHAPEESCPSLTAMNRFSIAVFRRTRLLTAPARNAAPLDRLGDSLVIDPTDTLKALVAVGLLLPLLASLGAMMALKWREFP